MNFNTKQLFELHGSVAVITGGGGLLAREHARSILDFGGQPVLIEKDPANLKLALEELEGEYHQSIHGFVANITDEDVMRDLAGEIEAKSGKVEILINNAANNPMMEKKSGESNWSRLESFPLEIWKNDIAVGLTGSYLCSRFFGERMARNKSGVILNIASDLALIGPDQRIYKEIGESRSEQNMKPVTYSVVKSGLIGLTRYLATYWAEDGVRVNALCPGGVFNGQTEDFVSRLTNLIPLGRMAEKHEYRAAVAFMVSSASSYMTGSVISVDGGRTAW